MGEPEQNTDGTTKNSRTVRRPAEGDADYAISLEHAHVLLFVVLWSSLAVFGAWWGVGVFIAVVALAICVQKMSRLRSSRRQYGSSLSRYCVSSSLISLLLPSVQSCREAPQRIQCP